MPEAEEMETMHQSYRYSGAIRFVKIYLKLFGSLFILLLVALPLVSLILHQNVDINYLGIAFAILVSVFVLIPFLPNIEVDEQGLLVEFIWKPLRVSWEKIVDIRRMKPVFPSRQIWLVRTKALTPYHCVFSLAFAASLIPGFIISSNLKEHMTLISQIESARRNANKGRMHHDGS